MQIESVILALNRIKTVAYSGPLLVVFYLFVVWHSQKTRPDVHMILPSQTIGGNYAQQ